jgi:predicted amidohydrolase YtcJ
MPERIFGLVHGATLLLAAALPLALACAPKAPPPPPADLVVRGGKIVTLDAQRPVVEALAARGDTIVAIGSAEEIAPLVGPDTQVLDLPAGALATPGFIEGHGHFLALGLSKMQLDLTKAATWEDIVKMVGEAARRAAPGAWIVGRGWHQDKWRHPPKPAVEGLPLHASLSAVSPDNPVLLTHASGHAVFVNTKAMELGGVTRETPDPPGGTIVRDRHGEPTGAFLETAEDLVSRREPPTAAEMRRAVELATDECLAKGLTSFQDAGSSLQVVDLYRRLARTGELRVRLWVMFRDSNERLAAELPRYLAGNLDKYLTLGGIKQYMDGALGSHGAWMLAPYADQPDTSGLNVTPISEIEASARLAFDHGLQMCVHAIGDRANREVLDLYERIFAEHPGKTGLRWRIEHAQHLDPADIPRFAKLGVIASMQAVHCTSDGPWVPSRIGDERAKAGAYVWRQLIDSGAVVTNGTDTPVEDVDPVAGYYAAVTRRLADGSYFYPEEKMTREEALRSYTTNNAYAAFEEKLKGTLSPGKLADLTVFSRDLLTIPDDEIPRTHVLYTIVGGNVRYARPSP